MSVALDFDQLSSEYTEKISRWLPYYQSMLEGVLGFLPADFIPQKVLDLGCGNGNLTQLIVQLYPGARLVLLDASREMLEVCKFRFADHPVDEYVRTYFQDAELPAQTFDLVTAALTIHHLEGEEKQALFQKVYESLIPGGFFSVTDLYVNKQDEPAHSQVLKRWEQQARALGTNSAEWSWIMDHYEAYDRPDGFEDQICWLREAGFESAEIVWQQDAWGCVLAKKK